MKAGFSRKRITPPLGTNMSGFGHRDKQGGIKSIHDDIYVRALHLEHNEEKALVLAFDLLFFSRANADRLKGALGNKLDMAPRRILLNTSHTHAGPCVDIWGYNRWMPPDQLYMDDVERQTLAAALEARDSAREVALWAGATRTRLPVSRRRPNGKGRVEWRPNPDGIICDQLPMCLFKDKKEQPVCLMYSVSCHPSTVNDWSASSDYPGVACDLIDKHLGATCSLFLQGAGGDTKACTIADGKDETGPIWRYGTPREVEAAGTIVAEEVVSCIKSGLNRVEPALSSDLTEMEWPLLAVPDRKQLTEFAGEPDELRRLWAKRQMELLDRGQSLPTSAGLLAQGLQFAEGARIVAIEGELTAEPGRFIMKNYDKGITWPLGYSNGTGLYLPSTRMLPEHGYEVDSFYECGFAAQLAPGMEEIIKKTIAGFKKSGIR